MDMKTSQLKTNFFRFNVYERKKNVISFKGNSAS